MLLRWILKRWMLAALWFRFRKRQVVVHAPLPRGRGAILAANHQNAVLDSITLAACSPQTPFTLSRASLFDNRILRYLLNTVQNIPIYRFRDGFGKMRRNPEVFRHFTEVLGEGGWLAIYPEGSHLIKYTLRPLQKGVARIAFAAQEAQGWRQEIPIIPVGFQYEDHTAFGSRLLVQLGPPISSLTFNEAYAEDPRRAERELTGQVFEGIKALLVVPPQDEEGYRAAVGRLEANRNRFSDLMDQFRSDQEVVEAKADQGPDASGARQDILRRVLGYVLSLPGQILNLPASLLTACIVAASTKDPHLAPSARFLTAVFLFPAWYLLALFLIHSRFHSFGLDLLLLVLFPTSLWLWSRCWHWTR